MEVYKMENIDSINPVPDCEPSPGVLAMAKVTIQPWCQVYDGSTALSRGTLFPALDLPYLGRRVTE
jgi:hypothetical protein